MTELIVRLVFSLGVVVGLLLLTVKLGGRRFRGRNGAVVRVVHRQPLSRSSAVAVVEVGSRILVLGTTEHQVNVLAELEEDELQTGEVIELDTLTGSGRADLQAVAAPTPARLLLEEQPDEQAPPALGATTETASGPYTGAGKRRRPRTHAARATRPTQVRTTTTDGPLVGSVLSPQTWRQALAAATGRAS